LLWDENNKEYIDAIASWWVNPYGHSNTFIADAIYKQLTTLEHVLFGGFTHEPAIEVAEKLMEILPKNQQKYSLIMDQQLLKLRLKSLCSISSKGKRKRHNCFRKCFSWRHFEQWQLVEFPFVEAFKVCLSI
jgi:hypothetical protein